VYNDDWSRRLCNGCYGRLLSLYEIKSGTATDDQKADELASALLSMVTFDDQRQAEHLLRTSETRAERISSEAARFIATAEHVAGQLQADPQLEWSPAVIGLCKAVEMEVVTRILRPLAMQTSDEDLAGDKNDKDLGRIAMYCVDVNRKPPELGSFAHFLQTVIHSQQRRETSVLVRAFLRQSSEWTGSHWLLDPAGLHRELTLLTRDFRNRAAHIDELNRDDYLRCRSLVIGSDGMLWKLVIDTEHHR
jgi:hypothetical protein